MAKNIEQKRCIHCLKIPDKITEDHVIPESWYSTHSKSNFKPRAPSCLQCNNELGEKEKQISHVMWMCMHEDHPLKAELTQRVYRACGIGTDGRPLSGLDEKERRIRLMYARKLLESTVPAAEIDKNRMMPGFGYHANYPENIQRATLMDYPTLISVASKVVRGLEYIQKKQNRYIEKPYKLEVYFPNNPHDPNLVAIRNICPIFTDGTNTIQRGAVPDIPLEPVYIIKLWNQWEIWGVIMHEDRHEEL